MYRETIWEVNMEYMPAYHPDLPAGSISFHVTLLDQSRASKNMRWIILYVFSYFI